MGKPCRNNLSRRIQNKQGKERTWEPEKEEATWRGPTSPLRDLNTRIHNTAKNRLSSFQSSGQIKNKYIKAPLLRDSQHSFRIP